MSIHISGQTEARLIEAARRLGISVNALLERLIDEQAGGAGAAPRDALELPVLHLGPMGALHRREIYDDVG